jgi:hypothetical protein
VPYCPVTGIADSFYGELPLRCFQLLQADYVGFGFIKPTLQNRKPPVHSVDIEGSDLHEASRLSLGSLVRSPRQPITQLSAIPLTTPSAVSMRLRDSWRSHDPSMRRSRSPLGLIVPSRSRFIAFRPGHDNGIAFAGRAPKPLSQVPEPAASVFAFNGGCDSPCLMPYTGGVF